MCVVKMIVSFNFDIMSRLIDKQAFCIVIRTECVVICVIIQGNLVVSGGTYIIIRTETVVAEGARVD